MRFEFGKNWQAFLSSVNEQRLDAAVTGLQRMLGVESLQGQSFLDIGCGSGLASLAAWKLGGRVHSFDYDEDSVACTHALQHRFAPEASGSGTTWKVEQGSVLDESYMLSLGQVEIVYSWGVLHHTGNLHRAIELAARCVAPQGRFAIAIYHDQGSASRRWSFIKQTYQRVPRWLRPVYVAVVASGYELKFALARLARCKNPLPFDDWRAKASDRGMSVWHDWVDWVGGWPFEVAAPDAIINPLAAQGFALERIKTVGNGWGCNEYVFRRSVSRSR